MDVTFHPGEALGLKINAMTGVVESVDPDSQADRAGVKARHPRSEHSQNIERAAAWDFQKLLGP